MKNSSTKIYFSLVVHVARVSGSEQVFQERGTPQRVYLRSNRSNGRGKAPPRRSPNLVEACCVFMSCPRKCNNTVILLVMAAGGVSVPLCCPAHVLALYIGELCQTGLFYPC